MTMPRLRGSITRALAAAGAILVGTAGAALAQSYSAKGQIGYLQEWEMQGSLARTASHFSTDYAGPVTLRHVGLCSINGVEEKSGTLELKVSSWTSNVEGTLVMPDDDCRIAADRSSNCRKPGSLWTVRCKRGKRRRTCEFSAGFCERGGKCDWHRFRSASAHTRPCHASPGRTPPQSPRQRT